MLCILCNRRPVDFELTSGEGVCEECGGDLAFCERCLRWDWAQEHYYASDESGPFCLHCLDRVEDELEAE